MSSCSGREFRRPAYMTAPALRAYANITTEAGRTGTDEVADHCFMIAMTYEGRVSPHRWPKHKETMDDLRRKADKTDR